MKKYIAELIGTFIMVLCGTGAIVVKDYFPNYMNHLGISLSFGLSVMVMIYVFGKTSGAHINPAVSLAFAQTSIFEKKWLGGYIIFQTLGAILASLLLLAIFPVHNTYGATLPAGSNIQSFVLEIVLSFLLMLAILLVSQHSKFNHLTAPAVGATVFLEAFFGGPVSGASMNPARSIGPALVSGQYHTLWIYILAPIIGTLLAAKLWLKFTS